MAGARILSRCKICGRRRGSRGLQKLWLAWWIWTGSEPMVFAQQAQGFLCYGIVTLQGSFRVAITGIRMPWLNFFVAGAVLLKHWLKKITETYCTSEVKCLVHMSFLREVSQKRCDFQFLGLIFDVRCQSPFTPCVIGQDVQAPCRAPGLLTVICDPAGGLDEQPMNQQIL